MRVPDPSVLLRIDPGRLLALGNQPVGAVARWDWPSSGAAVMADSPVPSTAVALPLLLVDYVSQNTVTLIRNPNDEAVSITAEIYAQGEATPVKTWRFTLGAGDRRELDAATDPNHRLMPNTPLGFLGSMTLRADEPIAAWTLVDIGSSELAVYGYAGQPPEAASETLYAPLIRKRFYGYDTGIAVVNPNTEAVEVSVEYIGGPAGGFSRCDGLRRTHGPVTLPAFGGHVFYQGAGGGSGLPDQCVGSAVIRAEGGPVQAIVNDALDLTRQAAAYPALPTSAATTQLLLPLLRRQTVDAWKMTTGIQLMNPGEETANVELTVRFDGRESTFPCGPACRATIPPLGTFTLYPGAAGLSVIPAGHAAEGTLASDRPILAIVNDASEIGARDMSTYTALPCQAGGPTLVALP
jgi:hypothetical protein